MTETPQAPPVADQPARPPVKTDRTFAWLAHLLMLFTWFIGPLVIWLIKKDDDRYAAFHAKQALCWSAAVTVLIIAIWIVFLLIGFLLPPLALLAMCAMWLGCVANLVYVIFAIVYTAQGKIFKYIVVADMFCSREFAQAYPQAADGQSSDANET